jgi:hypothetical protein
MWQKQTNGSSGVSRNVEVDCGSSQDAEAFADEKCQTLAEGEWKRKISTDVAVSAYCILQGPAPLRIDLV